MVYLLVAVAVAVSLMARFIDPFPGDVQAIRWVQTWQHPAMTALMEAVSWVGRSLLLLGLTGVAVAVLFLLRRRREALAVAGLAVVLGLTPLLQLLVDRPRPPAALVGLDHSLGGLGFPSGHAYQTMVFFGALFHLSSIRIVRPRLRRFAQASLGFLILSIGVSRVYLGAHWPSDVLGGFLLGAAFLVLLLRGLSYIDWRRAVSQERHRPAEPVADSTTR